MLERDQHQIANGDDLREVVTYCTILKGQQLLGMAGILGGFVLEVPCLP